MNYSPKVNIHSYKLGVTSNIIEIGENVISMEMLSAFYEDQYLIYAEVDYPKEVKQL